MKYFQMTEPGKSLGVVGLGGLGHMAVKFGKAFGLKVTVISTTVTATTTTTMAAAQSSF